MFAETTYVLEPELQSWLARPARLKAEARLTLRILVCVTLALAGFIGALAYHDLGELFALRAQGRVEQAFITNRKKVSGKAYSYYVTYALEMQGVSIEDEAQVSESDYNQKHIGDTVFLTFLPQSPQVHRLGRVTDERVRDSVVNWTLGMVACVGLLGAGTTVTAFEYSRELRLVREGVPAQAVISKCIAPQPNTKYTDYKVTYRFTPPSGEQVQTCSVVGSVGKQLSVGKIVTVLYDAAAPRQSRLYCALRYAEVARTDTTPS